MPPPRFITCQLCGQQFGSASIGIHTPQCQSKMMGRWQNMDPKTRGAPPMLRQAPQPRGSSLGPGARRGVGGGGMNALDSAPIGRSGKQAVVPSVLEYDEAPQLNRCRKCGRGFAFDRVAYHESVCKGNTAPRARYNSSQKRVEGFNGGDGGGFGDGGGGAFPALKPFRKPGATSNNRGGNVPIGRSGNASVMKSQRGGYTTLASSAPPNKTNWRSQHNEFINMIRDAKKYAPPPRQSQQPQPRAQRQPFQGSTSRNIVQIRQQATGHGYAPPGGGGSSRYGGGGYTTSSSGYGSGGGVGGRSHLGLHGGGSPPSAGGQRGTSGGYRAPSSTPGQRVFGSTTGRWEGRAPAASRPSGGGGGGGGGINISMSNECSVGMMQAFGRY